MKMAYRYPLGKGSEGDMEKALMKLSKYLYEYYGEKVIVLIDEYDTPI